MYKSYKVTVRQLFAVDVSFELLFIKETDLVDHILDTWSNVVGIRFQPKETFDGGIIAKNPLVNRGDISFFWEEI